MTEGVNGFDTVSPDDLHGNANDLSGRTFGRLTCIAPMREREFTNLVWLCRCECGEYVQVRGAHLTDGAVRSCGCLKRMDISGERFGRLTALEPTERRSSRSVVWRCRCDCGEIVEVRLSSLRSGNTKSCKAGGECSPNWQGGKTDAVDLERDRPAFAAARCEAFERDNYRCRRCGEGGELHPHHVLNFSQHPAFRFDSDNIVTLCAPCHRLFHRRYGRSYNDWVELLEFLRS